MSRVRAPAPLPPLLAVLQQRRLQADTVGLQARPAVPAPAQRAAWDGRCACGWSSGPHCEALLRAPGDVAVLVGQHIMRGGTDVGCPGRRRP